MYGFNVIHISYGGPDVSIVDRKGKKWCFEDHHYCGPSVIGKDGDPLKNQPPESSPFWEAVNCWYQQGKQVEQIGKETWAKWVKPTMPKMIHLGGNHYMLDTSKQSTEAGGLKWRVKNSTHTLTRCFARPEARCVITAFRSRGRICALRSKPPLKKRPQMSARHAQRSARHKPRQARTSDALRQSAPETSPRKARIELRHAIRSTIQCVPSPNVSLPASRTSSSVSLFSGDSGSHKPTPDLRGSPESSTTSHLS